MEGNFDEDLSDILENNNDASILPEELNEPHKQ